MNIETNATATEMHSPAAGADTSVAGSKTHAGKLEDSTSVTGPSKQKLILGLDIGTNSVGWALLRENSAGPGGIVDMGARVFEAGMDLSKQTPASRNIPRREARLRRRQLERNSRRLAKVLHCLQRFDLLPSGPRPARAGGDEGSLQHVLSQRVGEESPYALRARGLYEKLEPFECGRALYHLAQRRGFQSNRKSPEDDDEKQSDMLQELKQNEADMKEAGFATWGAYLAALEAAGENKSGDGKSTDGELGVCKSGDGKSTDGASGEDTSGKTRLRGRKTQRKWFKEEFNLLWDAQQAHHPELMNTKRKDELFHAIFDQRPLKIKKEHIGNCTFERNRKRAPMALLLTQRVRILQDINHIRVIEFGSKKGRALSPEQRKAALELLERQEKVTFPKLRKAMGLKRGERLNLEAGDRKDLTGNSSSARLRKVFGTRWEELPLNAGAPNEHPLTPEERLALQDQVMEDLLSYHSAEGLIDRAQRRWGLSEEEAKKFASIKLEPGHSSLSRRALKRLLPHLEAGLSYTEAVVEAGYQLSSDVVLDELPPASGLRNPVVERALTEVRKIVNHVIMEHGKPDMIRVELARDLKMGAKQREAFIKRQRSNEAQRKHAKEEILLETEYGVADPRGADIQKFLLWKECNAECPYTGQKIPAYLLFTPAVEVEHIIPYSRSFDDSYMNKTLCMAEENQRKGKRTPFEAYHGTPEWERILERVSKFRLETSATRSKKRGKGAGWNPKLERFLLEDVDDLEAFVSGFIHSQLTDTAYATRKSMEYLACLYGAEWRKHIQPGLGQVTAKLRQAWDMDRLLHPIVLESVYGKKPEGDKRPIFEKNRDDHRHHALDALVTAATTPAMIHALSREASRPAYRPRRHIALPMPWEGFAEESARALEEIIVSHRVRRKLGGQLHNESHYGSITRRVKTPLGGRGSSALGGRLMKVSVESKAVIRKSVTALSWKEVQSEAIVDGAVRRAVHRRLAELGGLDDWRRLTDKSSKKFFEKAIKAIEGGAAPPVLGNRKTGEKTPIRRVRVIQGGIPTAVGADHRQRLIKPGNNHHLEIFLVPDRHGEPTWQGVVVTLLEAAARRRAGEPIVPETDAGGNPCILTLCINEAVELLVDGQPTLCVVQKLSHSDYSFKRHNDARMAQELKLDPIRFKSDGKLQRAFIRKLKVDVLGRVTELWRPGEGER